MRKLKDLWEDMVTEAVNREIFLGIPINFYEETRLYPKNQERNPHQNFQSEIHITFVTYYQILAKLQYNKEVF